MSTMPKSFVYFIQAGDENGPVKIGCSENPRMRLADLQTAHYEQLVLLGVLPGTLDLERELHRLAKDSFIRGEWYRPSPVVMMLIAQSQHIDETPILSRSKPPRKQIDLNNNPDRNIINELSNALSNPDPDLAAEHIKNILQRPKLTPPSSPGNTQES